MLKVKIAGNNYNIRFSTRVLTDTDIIDNVIADQLRAQSITQEEREKLDITEDSAFSEAKAQMFVQNVVARTYTSTKERMRLTAELLAAGLQKNHSDKYGYYTVDDDGERTIDDKKRRQVIAACYDLMDDYADDATDDQRTKGEHGQAELFDLLTAELVENDFLSQITRNVEQGMEEAKPVPEPQDHKKKRLTKAQKAKLEVVGTADSQTE